MKEWVLQSLISPLVCPPTELKKQRGQNFLEFTNNLLSQCSFSIIPFRIKVNYKAIAKEKNQKG